MDIDIEVPSARPGDAERMLAGILRAQGEEILDGLPTPGLRILREQVVATSSPTAAEDQLLRMIDARLAART
jgi:hypothetical protein